jgi:hypothetical protein
MYGVNLEKRILDKILYEADKNNIPQITQLVLSN